MGGADLEGRAEGKKAEMVVGLGLGLDLSFSLPQSAAFDSPFLLFTVFILFYCSPVFSQGHLLTHTNFVPEKNFLI